MFHFFHLMRRVVGIHSGRDMSDEMMNFFVRDFVALFLCFLGFDEVKKKKLCGLFFNTCNTCTLIRIRIIYSLIIRIT